MTYRRNKNKRNIRSDAKPYARAALAIGLLAAAGIAFLTSGAGMRFMGKAGVNVASPFWSASNALRGNFAGIEAFLSSKQSLARENEKLRARVRELEKDLLGYDLIVSDNIDLRRMLGREESNEGGILLAGVLSRSSDLPYDTLYVDAGERRGIPIGALVLAGFSGEMSSSAPSVRVAAGRVMEVFPSRAKVRLFSSAGESTQVFLGPDNTIAELRGRGGGTFIAELPKDLDIRAGDTAVFPGAEGYFVALVETVQVDQSEAFQLAYLRTPFNPNELRYVGIFHNAGEESE